MVWLSPKTRRRVDSPTLSLTTAEKTGWFQRHGCLYDPCAVKRVTKFRRRVQESTQVLRELEISLRTNHIGWVREFLNEENKGLDVLVEYLSFAQYAVTFDFDSMENNMDNAVDKSKPWNRSIEDLHGGSNLPSPVGGNAISRSGRHPSLRCNTLPSRRTLKNSRLVCKKEDVHVCIMCLRAIMNYQVCAENQRFEKLMEHFKNEDNNIDFMVACMQFINIVVHSVEDMNFRVHLQYDFTKLSLDEYLDKLKHTESDKLQVQIQAYLDNVFDVGALLEDAETKNAALERVEELEENMSHMTEKLQDTENEAMAKIVELEKQLMQRNKELDSIREVYKDANTQVHTLRRMVKEKDEAIQRQCHLEKKIHELEKQGTIKIQKRGDGDIAILPSPPQGVTPSPDGEGAIGAYAGVAISPLGPLVGVVQGAVSPPPPPPPPPPPGPGSVPNGPSGASAPPPPPPPPAPSTPSSPTPSSRPSRGDLPSPSSASTPGCPAPARLRISNTVKIKKPIKTKFRMPVFNWVALKPNQINGTVFNEIDDERILEDLNVDEFEEMFKTKAQGPAIDVTMSKQKVIQKGPNKVTLLDANRAKNLAITLRKAGKTPEEICKAIQMFDLRTLPVDFVECLMRFMPTENEVKVLRQYERERKPLESLTDEDRFMMQFSKIERLMQKMTIMAFVGNFTESVQMLTPIILALGNYMNSSKRGAVYGFKLQSLDLLLDTKSTDRKMTLLHYIANVVKEKYQQVSLFYNELHYVEKAAAVSLENVLLDVRELQRGMELTKREYSMHGHNTMLKDFIAHNEGKLKKLQDDAKIAQDAFDDAVKFFGENAKTTPPSVFFPVFVRFVKAYRSPSHKNKRQQQELIAELRKKQVKDSRHVYEGKDGAIEDIITGKEELCQPMPARISLRRPSIIHIHRAQAPAPRPCIESTVHQIPSNCRLPPERPNGALGSSASTLTLRNLRNQPYRRADAVRRSVRRRFDDQNLRPVNNAEVAM
ncbi:hypothetical protein JZ751_027689 [Albula glossodonta]|uniref:Formin-like protein 2 n=1 Tax=Albula glossodonta TaxID=121402 RepID=A0A8T2PBZ0_9TELE|nr:hypothetical protein JZ751_027689 [Albula glossodonta]